MSNRRREQELVGELQSSFLISDRECEQELTGPSGSESAPPSLAESLTADVGQEMAAAKWRIAPLQVN